MPRGLTVERERFDPEAIFGGPHPIDALVAHRNRSRCGTILHVMPIDRPRDLAAPDRYAIGEGMAEHESFFRGLIRARRIDAARANHGRRVPPARHRRGPRGVGDGPLDGKPLLATIPRTVGTPPPRPWLNFGFGDGGERGEDREEGSQTGSKHDHTIPPAAIGGQKLAAAALYPAYAVRAPRTPPGTWGSRYRPQTVLAESAKPSEALVAAENPAGTRDDTDGTRPASLEPHLPPCVPS